MEILKNSEKSKELIIREEIKNTPFMLINDTEKNIYFGTFGNYKITEDYLTKEHVIEKLTNITYENIITLCTIICDVINKQNNNK